MRSWLRENAYTGLRVALGLILLWRGIPHVLGCLDGFKGWTQLGGELLGPFGIDRFHPVTGFLISFCEVIGGGGLVLGFMFYPAVVMIFLRMGAGLILRLNEIQVAAAAAEAAGQEFHATGAWHAQVLVLLLLVFFAISGPGPWAVDNLIVGRRRWRLTQRALRPFAEEVPEDEETPLDDAEGGEARRRDSSRSSREKSREGTREKSRAGTRGKSHGKGA